jgi:DNA-binding winged helix-turn-helix (wHTH) protein
VIPVDSTFHEPHDIETATFVFGPFRLTPSKRLLTKDGQPIDIGGRALGILSTLVERPGCVLSKRELMKRVWPDTIVEQGCIRFQMACLRKLLGDGENGARYIATQVGVGYAFVAPIERLSREDEISSPVAPATPESRRHIHPAGSPPPRIHLIGRRRDAQFIIDRLVECRSWCERAIQLLDKKYSDSATEPEFQASLGLALMFTCGNKGAVPLESALKSLVKMASSDMPQAHSNVAYVDAVGLDPQPDMGQVKFR